MVRFKDIGCINHTQLNGKITVLCYKIEFFHMPPKSKTSNLTTQPQKNSKKHLNRALARADI